MSRKQKAISIYVSIAVLLVCDSLNAIQGGEHGYIIGALINFVGMSGLVFITAWVLIAPTLLYLHRRMNETDNEIVYPDKVMDVDATKPMEIDTWYEQNGKLIRVIEENEPATTHPPAQPFPTTTSSLGKSRETVGNTRNGKLGNPEEGEETKQMDSTEAWILELRRKKMIIKDIADLTGVSKSKVGRIVKKYGL